MNINEISESKYLKKEDVGTGKQVQITGLSKENLAREDDTPDYKFVLHFNGPVKPMVLNKTNAQLIAHVLGSQETDDWIGKTVTLYNDPTISFAGKLTGGIRVMVQQPQTQPSGPAPVGEFKDDDIPY